jgi:hypothetical protein
VVEIYVLENNHSTEIESGRRTIMTNIMPTGDDIRRAVKWISENLEANPCQSRMKLIEQAVFKFDLSPVDAEFLMNFTANQGDGSKKGDCTGTSS